MANVIDIVTNRMHELEGERDIIEEKIRHGSEQFKNDYKRQLRSINQVLKINARMLSYLSTQTRKPVRLQ